MSAVVAGTKLKVQNLMPGMIGTNRTFSDSYVNDIIMAGFNEVAEKCGLITDSVDISLVAGQLEYDLDSSLIDVRSVDFGPNGGDIDGSLTAVTLDDLDRMSCKWRDDRGTRPEYYTLLGAPGVPETSTGAGDGSKILIYRAMSSVDDDYVKVTGIKIGASGSLVPDDIQRMCLVPYTLAHLKAVKDPRMAQDYYMRFLQGCERIADRYGVPLTETPVRGNW